MARAQGRLLSASICELSSREDMIGRRHSAWVSQAVFSDKDKPDKALQVVFFGLVLRVWGFFFCCVCFLGFPRGGFRNQVESAGSAGRRNVESVRPGGAGHRQGFSPVLFPLLSVCAWISLFFAVELLPTLVGIHGFLGNLC